MTLIKYVLFCTFNERSCRKKNTNNDDKYELLARLLRHLS